MKFLIVFALALATAAVDQFPYQVGLSLKISATSSAWCGGSLIDNQWVLTAAQCTDGVQSVTVFLGVTNRTKAEVIYTVSASNIIIHAGWYSQTLRDDISLIKIPATAYTAKIQPVQLPALSSSYSTYTGEQVIASSWGLIYNSSTSFASDLQWARMEVIDNTACFKTYGLTVTSTHICVATSDGDSTCQGDSGGPLVLESSQVQIGLTSGCANGLPAVYTRVTSYLSWIKANTDNFLQMK